MDTPSHFFNDCVDFDNNSVLGTSADLDENENSALTDHSSELTTALLLSPTSRRADTKTAEWGVGSMDTDLFAEAQLKEQIILKTEQDRVEDAITVIPSATSISSASATPASKLTLSTEASGATTDTPPPPSRAPTKSRKRKSSAAIKVEEDDSAGEPTEKRQKFLERNRVAATKCRQKKKQWIGELEDRAAMLEDQRAFLVKQRDLLVEEIKGLKYMLMMHAQCNEPRIDHWLETEAQRFVAEHTDRMLQQPAPFPPEQGFSEPPEAPSHNTPPENVPIQPGLELEGLAQMDRRGSVAYSHTSTVQTTSPIEGGFPSMMSPQFHVKEGEEGEEEINLDYMPDSIFCSDQPLYL